MVIQELALIQFRNYRSLRTSFAARMNLIVGRNGQGKSNLAEGIHYLLHLSSFRTRRLDQLVMGGEGSAGLQGTLLRDGLARQARIELTRKGRRVWLDGNPIAQTSAYVSEFFSLLFNPDSLYFYRHYPAERRTFFNRYLSFTDRDYLSALRAYREVHAQKNEALKRRDTASLPEWNHLLIEKSYAILMKRRALMAQIEGVLAALCTELTGRAAALRIELVPSLRGAREDWPAQVEQARAAELEAGHALVGPHRDDYRLSLDEPEGRARPETQFSQGEYRVALLALELALNRLLSERQGTTGGGFAPVLILDDLFSELDVGVRTRVMEHLERLPNQIFITATEAPRPWGSGPAQVLTIEAGQIVRPEGEGDS